MPEKVAINPLRKVVAVFRAYLWMVAMLVLAGCASSSTQPLLSDTSSAMPPVESQVPTEYEKVFTSQPQRPDWIDSTPDDAGGLHFIVGLSETHASERGAREEAMRNAREEYAKYTGVDVAVVDEVIKAMYGQTSEILDPTVAQKSVARQTTDAQVSRIKAKQWYWERFKAFRRGEYRGDVYKSWVLVTVPDDEFFRVQDWKKKQEEARLAARSAKENKAEDELRSVLQWCGDAQAKARKLAAEGEIVQALGMIQQAWNQLYAESERFAAGDECHVARTGDLSRAQKEFVAEIGTILGALYIDKGRFGTQTVAAAGGLVKVWVWARLGAEPLPVRGLALALVNSSGAVISRSVTDHAGRADFQVAASLPGQYKISIDTESGTLNFLNKEMVKAIARVENRLTIASPDPSLHGAIRGGVRNLFGGPALAPLPVQKVAMGPVTYGDTQQGSAFAYALAQVTRQQITSVDGLVVVEPRKRDADLIAEAVKTRGIGLRVEEKAQPALGSAAMQAVIDGAQAALEVRYTVQPADVWVELNLKEAGTDVLLGATTVMIPRESILIDPAGLIPKTAHYAGRRDQAANSIRLEVTSHLGDGQTYREGDRISYFISTDSDAYLLLVYEDVEHNLIRIIPNRYSGDGFYRAGNFIEVPAPGGPFEFVVEAPFGLERLWAFACNSPFPKLKGVELDNGLLLVQEPFDTMVRKLRNHGLGSGNHYGETSAQITTVAK